mmetsp:Transcript_14877/g.37476  ORF Transcript_14877/g.37476 Transcript_14877/m.37476 type:complete len:117 (-) Transcript_14877:628-978(-)
MLIDCTIEFRCGVCELARQSSHIRDQRSCDSISCASILKKHEISCHGVLFFEFACATKIDWFDFESCEFDSILDSTFPRPTCRDKLRQIFRCKSNNTTDHNRSISAIIIDSSADYC